MLGRLENLAAIGALALEHRAGVMHGVGQDMNLGVAPIDQLAVIPDDAVTIVKSRTRRHVAPPSAKEAGLEFSRARLKFASLEDDSRTPKYVNIADVIGRNDGNCSEIRRSLGAVARRGRAVLRLDRIVLFRLSRLRRRCRPAARNLWLRPGSSSRFAFRQPPAWPDHRRIARHFENHQAKPQPRPQGADRQVLHRGAGRRAGPPPSPALHHGEGLAPRPRSRAAADEALFARDGGARAGGPRARDGVPSR